MTSSLPRMRSTPELHEQRLVACCPPVVSVNCQPPGKSGREINSYFSSVKKNITCFAFFYFTTIFCLVFPLLIRWKISDFFKNQHNSTIVINPSITHQIKDFFVQTSSFIRSEGHAICHLQRNIRIYSAKRCRD